MRIKKEVERHKIEILIIRFGEHFYFYRNELDEFNEPKEKTTQIKIKGVFHETHSYVSNNVEDSTVYRIKPIPQILTLSDENANIKIGDYVEYNKKKYVVTGTNDYNNLGIATDISLEVIDSGSGF